MSIKLAVLKSGEDIIADVKEIIAEDKNVVGYLLNNPHSVMTGEGILREEGSEDGIFKSLFVLGWFYPRILKFLFDQIG